MQSERSVQKFHVVFRPNQKGLKFYVDRNQTKHVFDLLIRRLTEKGPPYHSAHVPQANQFLPKNLEKGSREHAIFLFMLCLWMRGGVESDTAASLLKEMYEKKPKVFLPENYRLIEGESTVKNSELNKKQIRKISKTLTEFNLGQRVEENGSGWVYNMRKLDRFWQGDPRELMNDRPDFDMLTKRIKGKTRSKEGLFINEDNPNGFMYFREKMVAMIAYFLMDSKLVPMFYTPVPVDFHVLRLLTLTGIFRVEGMSIEEAVGVDFYTAHTQRLAREITEWYCRKFHISPIALCDSLWLLSREFCRDNPGNSGYVMDDLRKKTIRDKRNDIPGSSFLFDELSKDKKNPVISKDESSDGYLNFGFYPPDDISGRKRYRGLRWNGDIWDSPGRVKRFNRSCGQCPVNDHCHYNISSGAYYTSGKLLPERLRQKPPAHQMDFFGHISFASSQKVKVDQTVRFAEIHLKPEGL